LRTARNAAWLTATRLAADLLSFLLFVAISRHFGPDGTGAYAYGFAVAGLISIGGTLGLDEYGIREYARLPESDRPRLLANLLGTQGFMIAVALLALAGYLLVTRPGREAAVIIVLLSTYLLTGALARTLFVPAFAHQAMAMPAVAEMACRGGAVAVALLLMIWLKAPLVIALLGFPVAGLVLSGVATASASRHARSLSLSTSWPAVASTVRAAWPFAASEVVMQIYARADLIMLSLIIGTTAAGIYASGFKFVEVGVMPLVFLGVAAYPRLSRLFEPDPHGFTEFATGLLRGTLFLGGLLAWALYFLVPVAIVPLFGDRFASAAPIVRIMAGLALLSAAEIALVRVMLAAHLQLARFRLLAIGTGLNVALNLFLIPLFQIRGAVGAWILTLAVIDVLYAKALQDCLAFRRWLSIFGAYAVAAACGLGMGLVSARWAAAGWVPAAVSLVAFVMAAVATRLVPVKPPELRWLSALREWGRSDQVEP
jgi:O-antigen/teichoic acid export membrane protein